MCLPIGKAIVKVSCWPNNQMGVKGLAPWRSGIAPESIGGVYGHNAMGSNPSASPPV